MRRNSKEITRDILLSCPEKLHVITRKANVNTMRVMKTLKQGLIEQRQEDGIDWSEKRKQVTIYHLTDEGRRFLDLYTNF